MGMIVSTKGGPISGHQGSALSAFPDVCTDAGARRAGSDSVSEYRQRRAPCRDQDVFAPSHRLRSKLQILHMQIGSLPSGNPTRWHGLLDEYVVLTAELYKTLSE